MSAPILLACAGSVCAGLFAVFVAARANRSIARWAFAAGMAFLSIEALLSALSANESNPGGALQWVQYGLLAQSFIPATWLLFSLTYARGNNRQFGVRVAVTMLLAASLPVFCYMVRNDAVVLVGDQQTHVLRLRWSGMVLGAMQLLGAVAVVMNLERTFGASVGTIRWRIKFMLLGVGAIFVARIYTTSQMLVFRGVDPTLDSIDCAALIIGTLLILRSFLRAGHFDLDVYPSQAVLQSSVTLVLTGLYLLIIGGFAKAVTRWGGDAAFPLKALGVLVSFVVLALILQSDRARQRLRYFVSRHFQRPLYDYRMVWKRFTDATASRVNQRDLAVGITTLVADIFQALSVNLWIANDKQDAVTLAASTTACAEDDSQYAAADVMNRFRSQPEPVNFEHDNSPWAETLRRLHSAQFVSGGHRYSVPLVNRGEVLGFITIGDRVRGTPFAAQDFEMLKCIGDHTMASLLNIRLSQQLLQARELEAFQSMAAFFIHDLKNAAATLNLMLQNLPLHFDNPEFRADALRGIGKTVQHINRLIGRLGELRHELKIELSDSDLNDIVIQSVAGLQHVAGLTLVKNIEPLPRIRLDGEQLNKVITNLLLNATEAVASDCGGRINITTGEQDGWVVLTVDDNGCGMSEDFVARSLFRPFQTTKKTGLGIGMFQSKMIVDAHGGRIAVASRPGKGTTFQVFLPAPTHAG